MREDERFVRDAEDLHTVIDVAAPLAALGTTVQVPSLDGDLPVEIPAGTQPGEIDHAPLARPAADAAAAGPATSTCTSTSSSRASSAASSATCSSSSPSSLDERNLRAEDEGMLSKLKRVIAG